MTIKKNIQDVQDRIKKDKPYAVKLKGLAVEAIYQGMTRGGKPTPEWTAYMQQFQKNSKELARLTTTATDCHTYTSSARAYLVGNGTCLPATGTGLHGGIGGYLDVTLEKAAPKRRRPGKSPNPKRKKG